MYHNQEHQNYPFKFKIFQLDVITFLYNRHFEYLLLRVLPTFILYPVAFKSKTFQLGIIMFYSNRHLEYLLLRLLLFI